MYVPAMLVVSVSLLVPLLVQCLKHATQQNKSGSRTEAAARLTRAWRERLDSISHKAQSLQVLLCANWGADANEYGNAVADALGARKNVWRRPRVAELGADGSVTFEGGSREEGVDAVCYATGYLYTFPFLDGVDLTVDDNRHAFGFCAHNNAPRT